jgi:cyclophilin family peptidyl-prolyl cis-trans isomerase
MSSLNNIHGRLLSSALALTLIFSSLLSQQASAANPQITIKTNHGNILIEVYPEKAPKTVANFLSYVKDGFYNKTIFHRVIDNFMIQGGGFTASMVEKPTKAPIINEADNGLLNETGTLAMARTNDPHSATSQFFINLRDNHFLDYQLPQPDAMGYCVFGRVLTGMDVVREIAVTPTTYIDGYQNVPKAPIIIEEININQ